MENSNLQTSDFNYLKELKELSSKVAQFSKELTNANPVRRKMLVADYTEELSKDLERRKLAAEGAAKPEPTPDYLPDGKPNLDIFLGIKK